MAVSHLSMFYDTRQAVHVNNSNPANNPNTELTSVPDSAEVEFADGERRVIEAARFEGKTEKAFETARFLIGRAMLDPDATVIPT